MDGEVKKGGGGKIKSDLVKCLKRSTLLIRKKKRKKKRQKKKRKKQKLK
jgi:hypothetical protein